MEKELFLKNLISNLELETKSLVFFEERQREIPSLAAPVPKELSGLTDSLIQASKKHMTVYSELIAMAEKAPSNDF